MGVVGVGGGFNGLDLGGGLVVRVSGGRGVGGGHLGGGFGELGFVWAVADLISGIVVG